MDYRLEQLRFQLREDPSSRLFFQLGELLRKEGWLEEAVGVLEEGLEKHPRYVAAWVSLGRALLTQGEHERAEEVLERALELDPENGVAARVVGEAAIARGEWLRAVKALKLARGLSPQDAALDERIRFVEVRLGERGELEEPSAPDHSTAPEPGVVVLSSDDPFAAGSPGDTGVWTYSGDVFQAGWVEEEEPDEEPSEGLDEEPDEEPFEEPIEEPEEEPSPPEEEEPPLQVEADGPVDDPQPDLSADEDEEEVPLPTMTLARLAIDQGDHELAEKTLGGLLARDPENFEAAELLESLTSTAVDHQAHPVDPTDHRVRALQGWLDRVRLASERLKR
jgi:tetratricopeptide (TPR) repeat protein